MSKKSNNKTKGVEQIKERPIDKANKIMSQKDEYNDEYPSEN